MYLSDGPGSASLVVHVVRHAEVVPGAVGVPRRRGQSHPRHLEAAILVQCPD